MDANLRAEVEAWIADDPDPTTASQLHELLTNRRFISTQILPIFSPP